MRKEVIHRKPNRLTSHERAVIRAAKYQVKMYGLCGNTQDDMGCSCGNCILARAVEKLKQARTVAKRSRAAQRRKRK